MGAQDISWLNLAFGYLLLLVPIAIMAYFRIGLVRSALVAVARMTVQLFLVGLYLEYIFRLDNPAVNLAWIALMLVVTTFTVLGRAGLKRAKYFGPTIGAVALCITAVDLFLVNVVLRLGNMTQASYVIPITGMLLGNILADMVVSLNYFYDGLAKRVATYRFALANGATHGEALMPFMRDALGISLNRGIASTAVMGLVSLPGMMTGQILGGSSPAVAIKYQILIMITIFVTSCSTNFLVLWFSRRKAFDGYKNLDI